MAQQTEHVVGKSKVLDPYPYRPHSVPTPQLRQFQAYALSSFSFESSFQERQKWRLLVQWHIPRVWPLTGPWAMRGMGCTHCQRWWFCHHRHRAGYDPRNRHCCIQYWLLPRTSSNQDCFHRSKHSLIPFQQTAITEKQHLVTISLGVQEPNGLARPALVGKQLSLPLSHNHISWHMFPSVSIPFTVCTSTVDF